MKKLKTLTAAATVGLASFATTTASAEITEFGWSGRVDKYWSTSGNWTVAGQTEQIFDVPSSTSQFYVHTAGTFDYDIVLDQDAEIAGWMCYGEVNTYRRLSGGHTLTVNGSKQDAVFSYSGVLEVSGENTKLALNGTTYKYQFGNTALLVTNGAQVVVASAPTVGANVTNSVIDGAYLEYAGLDMSTSAKYPKMGNEINLINNSILKVKGKCDLGNNNYTKTDMYIKGAKPAGGFLQVTSGTLGFGGNLKLRMTPEVSWGDTDDAVISYTGTDTGSKFWNDVGFRIDLAKLAEMPEDDEVTICLVSMNKGNLLWTGSTWLSEPESVTFYNQGDLRTEWKRTGTSNSSGMKLYLRVFRHNWDSGVVTQAPTKRHGYKKTYRCTDDGCSHTKTVEVPNSQLPGDYLMTDGTGYFKTTYYPSYSNTFAEICVAAPELATAANRSLFFANDYTDGGTKGYDEWGVTYWADKSGAFYYESDNEGMIQLFADGTLDTKFHTLLVGGGKAQLDNGPTLTAGEPKPGTAGGKLYLCAVPYKSSGDGHRYTGKFNIRYLKIWEKVDDIETMKFWLVPGKNGNQATFFDLVTEKYLTPTSGTGFTIGDDPGGIMMYLR